MPLSNEESHSEIMKQLGKLQGQMEAVQDLLTRGNDRFIAMDKRVGCIERNQAVTNKVVAILGPIVGGMVMFVWNRVA